MNKNNMNVSRILPEDYYEQFTEYENAFKEKYEAPYFSKPQIRTRDDGKGVVLAPWGNPGWSNPIIFPFCHYFTVTFLNKNQTMETLVFEYAVLISFLENKFQVEEIASPIPHILVKMPHLMTDNEEEQKFLTDLVQLPHLGNKE